MNNPTPHIPSDDDAVYRQGNRRIWALAPALLLTVLVGAVLDLPHWARASLVIVVIAAIMAPLFVVAYRKLFKDG